MNKLKSQSFETASCIRVRANQPFSPLSGILNALLRFYSDSRTPNTRVIDQRTWLCLACSFAVYAHYRHVGCFRDNATTRAIGSNRPLFNNATAIADCAAFAVAMPAHAFGVQMGNSDKGTCFVKTDAHETYERYGQLNDKDCIRGRGGSYRNSVYLLGTWRWQPACELLTDSVTVPEIHKKIFLSIPITTLFLWLTW